MKYIDYYQILGVPKNASQQDIKKAYRKLARKFHPDINPGDATAEKKFKEINEANEVLGNPENRAKYDEYGKDWQHAEAFEKAKKEQAQYRQSRQQSERSAFSDDEFSDFFSAMFGGRGGRQQRTMQFRGQDIQAELELPLEEVYRTHKRTLTVNGRNIRLTIPAGVRNGQVIKIRNHGGEGINGGPRGDLHIRFSIVNNTPFRRDEDNLYTTVKIDLYKAVLGGEIIVNTFDGQVKLNVKPGTPNGSQVKLKGKGFPVYKKEGHFGDLYITYEIEIPKNLSAKEKQLFEELAKLRQV
ncbi:curved DNA-binding protein [Muriicola jejuensis]|uniref:DnaJ domain-containing protein n=1 Tax=Muriicola jejuensis TaxID=504488 RepID=A0A6P0UFX7_9FLAO|nr:J domain-containing protein [Muriicola jejuensis]NER09016.1 DnaJ domain-containing protein [Muriicola jejuensis]SMP12096.1 curved DNA-binding protein [Muriicola jejuensis]